MVTSCSMSTTRLRPRVAQAEAAGVAREAIVVDPGIGFGKTDAGNRALMARIGLFHGLGCPILLGASRKGFVGRVGGVPKAADRGPGSAGLCDLGGVAGRSVSARS